MVETLIAVVGSILAFSIFLLRHSLLKSIETHYEKGLAKFKSTLDERAADVRAAIDLYSAIHSYTRKREIEAVESLYRSMNKADSEFAALMFCDWCILPEEMDKCAKNQSIEDRLYHKIRVYENRLTVSRMHGRCLPVNCEELFTKIHVVLWHSTYLRVLCRAALLLSDSLKERRYVDWREDGGMDEILGQMYDIDGAFQKTVSEAKLMRLGGLGHIVKYIKSCFILEAWSCISGSEVSAQSALDISRWVKSREDYVYMLKDRKKP